MSFDLLCVEKNQGKAIYLGFWTMSSSSCRVSFYFMNQLHREFSNKGLKVIAVNMDKDKSAAYKFISQRPANFEVIYDSQGMLAKRYLSKCMPTSFFIDKKGALFGAHVGIRKRDQVSIRKKIITLLNQ